MEDKIKYYLDETDQIEVDGHTLSRLYLAEHHPRLDKASQYAVFGEDNADRKMGGYIESLDQISDKFTAYDDVAWVDASSRVYGDSYIGAGTTIKNSTVANSTVQKGYLWSIVRNSTVRNSTVYNVFDSEVSDSYCSKYVKDSTVVNSRITSHVFDSNVSNSVVKGNTYSQIQNAQLDNVQHKGSISGTFSNIRQGDISTHQLWYRDKGYTTRPDILKTVTLLVGPDNTALTNNDHSHIRLINDKVFELGDVSCDELIQVMSEVVDGKTIGTRKTLEILETVGEQEVLNDADLDFGETELGR